MNAKNSLYQYLGNDLLSSYHKCVFNLCTVLNTLLKFDYKQIEVPDINALKTNTVSNKKKTLQKSIDDYILPSSIMIVIIVIIIIIILIIIIIIIIIINNNYYNN